jgi:hypothetical protein
MFYRKSVLVIDGKNNNDGMLFLERLKMENKEKA